MSRDALVVGINTYQFDRLGKLQAPSNDAKAVAQLLEQYGDFTVTRLPAVKDKQNNTIGVGKTTKVTLVELKKAIAQLFKPKSRQIPDTALLYFSGHGLREDLGIQEGFLATSDVNPDLGNWGLSMQWLRQLLQESEVRQQIIWLDCCYSGEILNIAEADPGYVGKARDRCFIAASRAYEQAYEEINGVHGVLTAALLEGLKPQGNGRVTNHSLADFLSQQRHSFPQHLICHNSGEAIDFTRSFDAPIEPPAPPPEQEICPYKGLAYFDCKKEDAEYFHGRTNLTKQLLDKVLCGNFLAVLGASGSGKSSVVRAGLLYQLKLGRELLGSDRWQIYMMQPGEHPLQSLALAFVDPNLPLIERAKQLRNAEDLIKQGATGLRCLVQASSSRVVLVIDQFEETFTLCQDQDERQKFFACLLGALEQIGSPNVETLHVKSLQIIITMRADFFGKCLEEDYSGLAQQIQENLVTVTPMNPDELRQAIVEPAKQVNLEIEPELVEEMLADVANAPGSLPLLQYALTELWKQRTDNCLRLRTYTKLGKVMGTLSQRANEVYGSFSEAQQAAVRHIFLSLTQLGEGTEDTRRRVLKPDLVNERYSEQLIDEVVQKLADEKLIVTSEMVEKGSASGRVAVVDVAHEALIRQWPLLRQLVDENRDILRQKRKIEAVAEEWRERGKAKDYLLQGKQLTDATTFQKEQAGKLMISNLTQEFIQKSLQHRRNNRFKLVGFGLIVPIALAVFLGIVAERQLRIGRLWQTVNADRGQKYSPGRNQALEELVKLGVSLNKIDLNGVNLSGANLSLANLSGANFKFANLNHANLENAILINANLENANLNDANLENASLIWSNLSSASLIWSNLRGADLSYADLNCWKIFKNQTHCTDYGRTHFGRAKNLTPKQVKSAKNWQQATYDEDLRKKLGLKK